MIPGRVVEAGRGREGLRVEAWDIHGSFDDPVGSALTDAEGMFRLEVGEGYTAEMLERTPYVFFRVFDGDVPVATTEESVVCDLSGETEVKIEVDLGAERTREQGEQRQETFVVEGQVCGGEGTPLPGVTVQAFDRKLRREELLGEATTGANGRYSIAYVAAQPVREGKKRVDLVVRVRDETGSEFAGPELVFDACPVETVNLVCGREIGSGRSEFKRVLDRLAPELDRVSPAELSQEDRLFLSGRTGVPEPQIAMITAAAAASEEAGLPVEALYGLLAQGLPADLPALLAQGPIRVRRAFEAAVDAKLVDPEAVGDADAVATQLRRLAIDKALESGKAEGEWSVGDLLRTTSLKQDEQRAFLELYAEHEGPIERFWRALRETPEFEQHVDELQFTLQLGVLTQNHLPLIERLQELRSSAEITSARDLAKLDEGDWATLLADRSAAAAIGAPQAVPGKGDEERQKNFANVLTRMVEDTFPTAAIAGRIEKTPDFPQRQELSAFFSRNPSFEFGAETVDGYLAQTPAALTGARERDALVTRLKGMERVFRFAPRFTEMQAMIADGLDSALAVVRVGETQFARRYAQNFGGEGRARQAYESAAQVSATALALLAEYAPIFNQPPTSVLPSGAATVPGLDWGTLFGSLNLCGCTECRSVLSPAAYLTDLLAFLKDRSLPSGKSAKDVLFERRPDLGEIELTCQNTNTRVPYVDLVNEVLESAVVLLESHAFLLPMSFAAELDAKSISPSLRTEFANRGLFLTSGARVDVLEDSPLGRRWHVIDTGWRYPIHEFIGALMIFAVPQTTGDADDLAATPEHTNPLAYDALAQTVYPWALPFNLWTEETRAYLGQLGVERADLMWTFRTAPPQDPTDTDIAMETLGLTPTEGQIIAGTHPDSEREWKFWGFSEWEEPTWITDLETVRTLLDRSGLEYDELVELLKLSSVNPGGTLHLAPADGADPNTCDPNDLRLSSLDLNAARRIRRFTVLWRKLGWSARDLDKAITAFKPESLDSDFLASLSKIEQLRTRFALPVVRLLGLYAHVDTAQYAEVASPPAKSLYEELFQNSAVLKLAPGQPDPFELNAERTELKTIRSVSSRAEAEWLRTLLAGAVGLSANELALLVDGPSAVVTIDKNLTLENASRLYRVVTLARALKLTIEDLLRVQALMGIDPFVNDNVAVKSADLKRTLTFADKIDKIRSSGFSIATLDYLLRHRVAPASLVAPAEEAIAAMLDRVRGGLNAISDALAPAPDPVGERTAQKLSMLGWNGGLVQQAVKTIGGETGAQEPLTALPADLVFPADIPAAYDPVAHSLSYQGAMTSADKTTLVGLSADASYQTAIAALVTKRFDEPREFVAESMKTFVDPIYEAPLANLPLGVRFPAPLSERTMYDSDAQKLRFVGTMSEDERQSLLVLSTDTAYQTAVRQLFDARATYVPPAENAFLSAADAAWLFDVHRPAQERYEYVLSKLTSYTRRTQSESLVTQTLAEALTLDVGVVNTLLTQWRDERAQPKHHALQEFVAESFVASTDKITAARYPSLFQTYIRLDKVASVVRRIGADADEVAWLNKNAAGAGWLAFNTLPIDPAGAPAAFEGWERLVDVFAWRGTLPAQPPTLFGWRTALLELLARALAFDPAAGDANATKRTLVEGWSVLAGWRLEELEAMLGPRDDATQHGLLGFRFPVAVGDANDYGDERTWLRIRDAFALLKQLGVAALQARAWSKPSLTAADARDAQQAAKAKYEPGDWLQVAKPLRDKLREKQRAALVAYLVARPDRGGGRDWKDAEGVSQHYLIDVQMDPCMMTSRIKQAISSVQLFVQRCLMNLEPEVAANATIDERWNDWTSIKNYRVWEAARNIFLWPENWLEPDLREGKSPFFKELENELLQNDVTPDVVEDAFLGYLEKLDQVAQLQVSGVYHQKEYDRMGKLAVDILHVFARTQGSPPKWFYRQRVGDASWTAWEKLDLEIEAPYVLPVMWNRRLHMFWPIYTLTVDEQPLTMPAANQQVPAPARYWKIELAWSERRSGAWAPKKITDQFATTKSVGAIPTQSILLRGVPDDDFLLVDLSWPHNPGASMLWSWQFRFSARQPGKVDVSELVTPPALDRIPSFTKLVDMALVETPIGNDVPLSLFGSNTSDPEIIVLGQTPGLPPFRVNAQSMPTVTSLEPSFFADGERTFFLTAETVDVATEWARIDTIRVDWVRRVAPDLYWESARHAVPLSPDRAEPARFKMAFPVAGGLDAELAEVLVASGVASGTEILELTPEALTYTLPSTAAVAVSGQPRGLRTARSATPDSGIAAAVFETLDRAAAAGLAGDGQLMSPRVDPETEFAKRPTALFSSNVSINFRFAPFYHPYTREFVRELRRDGIDGLLQRPLQVTPWLFRRWPSPTTPPAPFDFKTFYDARAVTTPYPEETLDFDYAGAYALYNWELFFHAPLLIAERLSQNQKFQDAQRWLEYIFDPTDTSDEPAPQKYWRVGKFFKTSQADYQQQQIERLLQLLAGGDPDLINKVKAWRGDAFNPHLVAQLRTTAYQKSVVMKYLDNLIAWGDQLFRQGTIESMNEATQLYVLAAGILGEEPEQIAPRALPAPQTYSTLEPEYDRLSNALVGVESLVPFAPASRSLQNGSPLTLPPTLYFCVPRNERLVSYWTTVADRLFQIRHCMNIEGLRQQPPLFEPPIDTALVARAAAAGIDISSGLSDISAALPAYRFQAVAQKATEICAQTIALGSALLNALEKRDAEALALLRSSQEVTLLYAVRELRQKQIDEAEKAVDAWTQRKEVVDARSKYYGQLIADGLSPPEQAHLVLLALSGELQSLQAGMQALSGVSHYVPDFKIGSPTTIGGTTGGSTFGAGAGALAAAVGVVASFLSTGASLSSTVASLLRRQQEWQQQKDLADRELKEMDTQIGMAELRKEITTRELANHDIQIANAQKTDELLRTKFTNRDLYDWMVSQIAGAYFQSYQLAYDVAKRAERCYRHELGLENATFIRFGYWDSLKKGLVAGERLMHDIKRMEAARLDEDRREYELTKTVSLALVAPEALIKLKQTGDCFLTLGESIFDADHPGHYMRRLKTVSLTIPCVVGPYTGVHSTLSYIGGYMRKNTSTSGGYGRTDGDARFIESTGPIQSIATSTGQNDPGLFELNFHDERYLAFEGQGAVDSQWRLQLDQDANRFDFDTIPDVLLHIRYTARQGDDALRVAAKAAPPQEGIRMFSARHDFPDAWQRFLHPRDDVLADTLELQLTDERFPSRSAAAAIKIDGIDLFLKVSPLPPDPVPNIPLELYNVSLAAYENASPKPPNLLGDAPLQSTPELGKLHVARLDLSAAQRDPGPWLARIAGNQIPAFLARTVTVDGIGYKHLNPDVVEDMFVVCHFGPA